MVIPVKQALLLFGFFGTASALSVVGSLKGSDSKTELQSEKDESISKDDEELRIEALPRLEVSKEKAVELLSEITDPEKRKKLSWGVAPDLELELLRRIDEEMSSYEE